MVTVMVRVRVRVRVGVRVRVRVMVRVRVRLRAWLVTLRAPDRLDSEVDRVHVGRLPFEK